MKLNTIKSQFTLLTGVASEVSEVTNYLKATSISLYKLFREQDFRKRETWYKLLQEVTKREHSSIRLSEIVNYSSNKESIFITKLEEYCISLIGEKNVKRMTYADQIDFIVILGLYNNDLEIEGERGRGVYFSPLEELQFSSYESSLKEGNTKVLSKLISIFPPLSSKEESREEAFKLYDELKDTCFKRIADSLVAFHNYKKDIWHSMDYVVYEKYNDFELPTSEEKIEELFKWKSWWDCYKWDYPKTDLVHSSFKRPTNCPFKELRNLLNHHSIIELSLFLNECFYISENTCSTLVYKYKKWEDNEEKREKRRRIEDKQSLLVLSSS